jgi:hypothetical protein
MNRTLKRPMFRMGGSTGTGITSGLDQPRKQYNQGSNPYIKDLILMLWETLLLEQVQVF